METKREKLSGLEFPTTTHQRVTGWLFTEIAVRIRDRETGHQVIAAPFAVFLEEGDSYVKPDITIVGDGEKLDDEGCHGAPDWVVEVVSPDSRAFDYGGKLAAYIDAGVREYWVVDPEKQIIVAYYLENPDVPVIYRFGDRIKSGIYEGMELDSSPLADIRYGRDAAGAGNGSAKRDAEEARPGNQSLDGAKMMSVEEVKAYMEENYAELVSAGNKGQMMKAAINALKGKADSKTFNEAVVRLCR